MFLITTHTPEHGSSGGGLFLANGELVGVCIRHAALVEERRVGSSRPERGIRHLLDIHADISDVIVCARKDEGLPECPFDDRESRYPSIRTGKLGSSTPAQSIVAKLHMDDGP